MTKQNIQYVNPKYSQVYVKVLLPGNDTPTIACFSVHHLPYPGDTLTDFETGDRYQLIRQDHRLIPHGSRLTRIAPVWECKKLESTQPIPNT